MTIYNTLKIFFLFFEQLCFLHNWPTPFNDMQRPCLNRCIITLRYWAVKKTLLLAFLRLATVCVTMKLKIQSADVFTRGPRYPRKKIIDVDYTEHCSVGPTKLIETIPSTTARMKISDDEDCADENFG